MKKCIYLFLLSLLPLAGFAQSKENIAINYVNSLLPTGNHKLEILEKDIPKDLMEIILRYRKAIDDSIDWYNAYSQEHKSETPLPYNQNFGISSAEYERMNSEFSSLKMKVKTSRQLVISRKDSVIDFKGDGTFTIFNTVSIDIKKDKVFVDDQDIPYAGEVSDNGITGMEPWKGYKWKLETGNMADIKAFKQADYSLIDISIGKTLTTNETVIQYKMIYVDAGEPRINGSVIGYLN